MDPTTRDILLGQNPWLRDPRQASAAAARRIPKDYLSRDIEAELEGLFEPAPSTTSGKQRALMLMGPRQVGKSTLLWKVLASHAVGKHPLLYLPCEELLVRELCRSPTLFIESVAPWFETSKGSPTLFFEEAQSLEDAGIFFKGLVDAQLGWRLLVTGSSSFHLQARTRESLAGRAVRKYLWPFSLAELAPRAPGEILPAFVSRRSKVVDRMMVYGSYPEPWLSQQPEELLRELAVAVILRDASDRFRIERPDAFRKLLRLAAGQVGDLVNMSEWAQILGISAGTVGDYLALLEETHVIRLIRPFVGGKRAELTQAPKVYFIDNGIRNALTGGFEPLELRGDLGKLFENWVFTELHRRYPEPGALRFWRTKGGAEVDFVAEPSSGDLIAIEAKSRRSRATLSRGARSFVEAYAPKRFHIVHRGSSDSRLLGKTSVAWVPAELLSET